MSCVTHHIQHAMARCTSGGQQIISSSLTRGLHFKHLAPNVFIKKGLPVRRNTQMLQHRYQLYPSRHRCGFHTSPKRDIHPALWMALKPIFKISAALTGRGVRKWYGRLDPKEKRSFWAAVKEKWYLFVAAAGAFAGVSVVYYQSHIQDTPITGRKRFVALTHDQIISISKSEAETILSKYNDKLFKSDSPEAKRVMSVAGRLFHANEELQKMSFESWTVYVIKDPLVNAFVLPSGHIFVFEGMLDMTNTPDELAVILGHEMAHALLEHGIEELSHQQFIDYFVIVLMAALWCVIPNDGIALVTQWFHNKLVKILTHLPHSRAIEQEADKVGAMLAAKACFDIRDGVVLWKKMDAVQKLNNDADLPTFLSTHPHNLKRAEFFDFIIPKAEQWRSEKNCPMLPKKDPREAIKIISKIVDNHTSAAKTGQNLKRVQLVRPQIGKADTDNNVQVKGTESIRLETDELSKT